MASKSFLNAERLALYAVSDTKQTAAAITVTIRRLGPSGSLKKINITLVKIMDVIAKIKRGIFLGKVFIFLSIAI
jgi:hypothetical protein